MSAWTVNAARSTDLCPQGTASLRSAFHTERRILWQAQLKSSPCLEMSTRSALTGRLVGQRLNVAARQ
jgi:hypothetical protein